VDVGHAAPPPVGALRHNAGVTRPRALHLVEQQQDARVPLVLRIDGPGAPGFHGATEKLSSGGLFIRTDRAFTQGERVPLLFSFPGLLGALELEVEVAWTRPPCGELPAGAAVRIPADREPDRAKLSRLAEGARKRPAPGRTYRILLVEDNALVEALYETTLKRLRTAGGEVAVSLDRARDGEEALARLGRKPRVNLVVTDLYMPVMDGFTLVERIRADPALVMTPVLAISAGGPDACERAVELGVDVYLQKPVKIAAILETVRALLGIGS
jgi:CheY-like chemotaxis protein